MRLRVRLLEVDGSVLEDHEIELSEATRDLLARNVNSMTCPQVTIELIWDPELLATLHIPPGQYRGDRR